jgi:endonuclease/exonuclease/phosphatase family metal-dependent hydrolase
MSRRRLAALAVALWALVAGCGDDDPDRQPAPGEARAAVLTRNVFIGTGLEALFTPDLAGVVRRLYDEVRASDPPARMARVADEIAARRPELVALQEAAIFATVTPPSTTEVVEYDFVALLVDALRTRGLDYRLVSSITNFDQSIPDETLRIVHFADRDAILARADVATREPAGAHFANRLEVPLGILTLAIPRGWCAITADVAGTTVRLVNTHLEAVSAPVREAQARELATLLAAESRPVLLLGDVNSPPAETTGAYGILRGAGFGDAWDQTHPGEAGLTCCFETDLRTADPLEGRIDVVLLRGPLAPESAEVVGEEPADRTASGLWPSDHAGVAAVLRSP